MAKNEKKRCKECPSNSRSVAKYPGPRCAKHHRAVKQSRSEQRWVTHIADTYRLTPERYWELYELQGGYCYICQRANGKTRRLSVDHDHACCKGSTSCGSCVRGLLCKRCNTILGHARDETEYFRRAIEYLNNPPAQR